MGDLTVYPPIPGADTLPPEIQSVLHCEPGVGFSIVDALGKVRFVNRRGAELFLHGKPEDAIGKSLPELFGAAWAEERMEVLDRIVETRKPAMIRQIRHGLRIQSTIYPLAEPEDDEQTFLVLTVPGEHAPDGPDTFEILESKLVHLGPLDVLTKREIEVLALIGHGMTSPQIATALHRSPQTIERHCDSLRLKLRTTNRVQLAEFARAAGLRLEDASLQRL